MGPHQALYVYFYDYQFSIFMGFQSVGKVCLWFLCLLLGSSLCICLVHLWIDSIVLSYYMFLFPIFCEIHTGILHYIISTILSRVQFFPYYFSSTTLSHIQDLWFNDYYLTHTYTYKICIYVCMCMYVFMYVKTMWLLHFLLLIFTYFQCWAHLMVLVSWENWFDLP